MTQVAQQQGEFALYYDRLIFGSLMRDAYGGAAYYNVGDWSGGSRDLHQACEALMDRVLALLPPSAAGQGSRLLDVGCGLGAGTRRLADRFPDAGVVAINISPRQASHAQGLVPRADLLAMDATRLAFRDASFDGIQSIEAAFHFAPRGRFFEEARRVLRPGGSLVLTDMLVHTDEWVGAQTIPAGNNLPDLDAYGALCRSSGLEVDRLDDISAESWDPYVVHLGEWAAGPSCPDDGRAAMAGLSRHLADVPVTYLLARLRRP